MCLKEPVIHFEHDDSVKTIWKCYYEPRYSPQVYGLSNGRNFLKRHSHQPLMELSETAPTFHGLQPSKLALTLLGWRAAR